MVCKWLQHASFITLLKSISHNIHIVAPGGQLEFWGVGGRGRKAHHRSTASPGSLHNYALSAFAYIITCMHKLHELLRWSCKWLQLYSIEALHLLLPYHFISF